MNVKRKLAVEFLEIMKERAVHGARIFIEKFILLDEPEDKDCIENGLDFQLSKNFIDICIKTIDNETWNELHVFKEKHGMEIEIEHLPCEIQLTVRIGE